MARGCNEELKAISAWPTDVLHAKEGGPVVGFLMPKITDYEPVHKVYGPTHRKEAFPHADWRFLVRTAKNLAAAFYVIHKFGYVVGDVNEGNILVNDTACVRLIDCDSFQVRAGDRLWYCEVGVAQFTPPEIQHSKDFSDGADGKPRQLRPCDPRSSSSSSSAGTRYSGVYSGKEDMPIEKAITEFRFAYGKNSHLKSIAPPPNSVGLSVVPDQVAELFEKAFSETGARPSGRPGCRRLVGCARSARSEDAEVRRGLRAQLLLGARGLPVVQARRELGAPPVPERRPDHEDRSQARVAEGGGDHPPGPMPRISPENFPHRPVPLAPCIERSLGFRKVRQIAGMAVVAGFVVLALAGDVHRDRPAHAPLVVIIAPRPVPVPGSGGRREEAEKSEPRQCVVHVGPLEQKVDCRSRRCRRFLHS